MSFVTCPCGFRADGLARHALDAYRAHSCPHHQPEEVEMVEEESGYSWPGLLALVAVLVFLSFICTNGWGRFA